MDKLSSEKGVKLYRKCVIPLTLVCLKLDKPCRQLDKRRRLLLKYSFYFCDLQFTSLIISMKITSVICLMLTATLFLLQQIGCLYRDCINNLTKPTLIACKLLSTGDFMKQLILVQGAGMVFILPYIRVQKMIQYFSQEVRGKSTHDSHNIKATVIKSVQVQKAYLQPGTIAIHKWVLQSVNLTILLTLWVYAVFRYS